MIQPLMFAQHAPNLQQTIEPNVFVQQITIGLIIPNETTKITCASENFRYVKQTKQFSCFDNMLVHNQKNFIGFRVIPPSRSQSF